MHTLIALALASIFAAAPNALSPAEKKAGWRLLFDGKSTAGWRGFKQAEFPNSGWVVKDGALYRPAGKGGGDIVTVDQFDNYELVFEWKITKGGNSGVKYLIDEAMVKSGHSGVGFEYQVLDDEAHPDAKKGIEGTHTVGALYDLIPPAKDKVTRAIGQWNESRVVVEGNHIEQWLNGKKVVEFERGSDDLKARIAKSKFAKTAGFGEVSKGHVLIQDHGDEASYRNIKLRPIKK